MEQRSEDDYGVDRPFRLSNVLQLVGPLRRILLSQKRSMFLVENTYSVQVALEQSHLGKRKFDEQSRILYRTFSCCDQLCDERLPSSLNFGMLPG